MGFSEITIDYADEAQLADGKYMVFGGLQNGMRVRILILAEEWDRFLLAFDGRDGPEARADLARIAASSEPFRTEVDGVPEYKVRYRASPIVL